METEIPAGSKTLEGFNLSRGAFGIDRVHNRYVMIKPCGAKGVYAGWVHVEVTALNDDADVGSYRRTRKGVHEKGELAEWLHTRVNPKTTEWYPGNWDPTPDTYIVDQLHAKDEAEEVAAAARAERKAHREALQQAKTARRAKIHDDEGETS